VKRRSLKVFLLMVATMFLLGVHVSAFEDIPQEDEARDKILKLRELGVLNGIGGQFQGDKDLTYAEGIQMIVKGMDLNLSAFLFIKAPEARDSFDHVPEDAWYTKSFIIAAVHGLQLDRALDPNAVMTREEFAHHLLTALDKTGPYPFTKMLFPIADEADVNPDYMPSIQLLLNAGILSLDEEGRFLPKQVITRKEAAVMLYDAMQFRRIHGPQQEEEKGKPEQEVSFEITEVNEEVNKVTVSWGERPNPGYGISISNIHFIDEYQTAVIYYRLSYPDPERVYPQVIVYPKDETYVSSAYKVVIVEEP